MGEKTMAMIVDLGATIKKRCPELFEDHAQDIAQYLFEAGYRLDPYPNGKSKDELIKRIEAVEAERDRTRWHLEMAHDEIIQTEYRGIPMIRKRELHWGDNPSCPFCKFLTDTSTAKQPPELDDGTTHEEVRP